MSLATIYNALNQFTQAGLLREVAIEGQKTYFDTNTSSHHHFYLEGEERLVDIPDGSLRVMGVPETPAARGSTGSTSSCGCGTSKLLVPVRRG